MMDSAFFGFEKLPRQLAKAVKHGHAREQRWFLLALEVLFFT